MRDFTPKVAALLEQHQAAELTPGPGDPVFVDGNTEENVILGCLSQCTAYDVRTAALLEALLGIPETERVWNSEN